MPARALRRPAWTRHPTEAVRESALVLGVVAVALAAHGAGLWSSQAILVHGSHSAATPASGSQVALDLTAWFVSSAALLATYVALLLLVRRRRVRGLGRMVVLAAPVLLQVLLLLPRPTLSTDVLSYIAQGFIGVAGNLGNAYTNVPRDVLGTTIGDQLTALGWRPQTIMSPYGPLWTAYETLVMSFTRDVGVAIFLMKLAPVAASLASAALIWRILGLVRPRLRLLGTVVWLWNPVVITELAAEGHVDGLVVLLVLAGIGATLQARPLTASVFGTFAALTKYLPAILLPAQLVYLWRTSERPAALRRRLVLGAFIAAGLVVLTFAPFWAGLRTLEGLRVMGQSGPWPTVTGYLYRYVERVAPGVDGGVTATILVTGAFAVFLLRTALKVRGPRSLLLALARTSLAFVLIASPVFYPWYAVLPIALVALVPEASFLIVIVALSVMSRVVSPLVDLRPAFDPIPSAAYTLTSVGLFVCIAITIALGLRAVWAWAGTEPSEPGESPAAAA